MSSIVCCPSIPLSVGFLSDASHPNERSDHQMLAFGPSSSDWRRHSLQTLHYPPCLKNWKELSTGSPLDKSRVSGSPSCCSAHTIRLVRRGLCPAICRYESSVVVSLGSVVLVGESQVGWGRSVRRSCGVGSDRMRQLWCRIEHCDC